MILKLEEIDPNRSGLIIMPNQAMPWPSLVKIFVIMSVIILLIAIFFALKGFVLVLPFAGLDILFLGFALYSSARFSQQKQIVILEKETIKVEFGTNKPEKFIELSRHWAKLEFKKPAQKWSPSKLLIRSHGKEIELGQFLNEEEREGLARLLKQELQG